MALFRLRACLTFGFQSITFEGLHQFHSRFEDEFSIIKYRSSSNLEIIGKSMALFDLGLRFNNFGRDASILFKIYRKVKHC